MTNWYILSQHFPDDLPEKEGLPIYVVMVTQKTKKDTPVASPVMEAIYDQKLQQFVAALEANTGTKVFWTYARKPYVSENVRVLYPPMCEANNSLCEYYDNGYCLKQKKCPSQVLHPELSIL